MKTKAPILKVLLMHINIVEVYQQVVLEKTQKYTVVEYTIIKHLIYSNFQCLAREDIHV